MIISNETTLLISVFVKPSSYFCGRSAFTRHWTFDWLLTNVLQDAGQQVVNIFSSKFCLYEYFVLCTVTTYKKRASLQLHKSLAQHVKYKKVATVTSVY